MKRFAYWTGAVALAFTMTAGSAFSAEPIVGTWKRDNGTLVKFSGGGNYCGTVQNGKYKGKRIGCLSGSGKNYRGKITDLESGKTYSGKATVAGKSMKLSGCVLGGLICRGETWRRQ